VARRVYDIEVGYYADGEDAYDMRMPFTDKCREAFSSQVGRMAKSLAERDAKKAAAAAAAVVASS
jgi:hypothetical protein